VPNTTGCARAAVIELPGHITAPALQYGREVVATQPITTLTGERCHIARLANLPATSLTSLAPADAPAEPSTAVSVDELVLENEHLRVQLDDRGQVVSLIHKATGRQAVATGHVANQFVLYEDLPADHDAW